MKDINRVSLRAFDVEKDLLPFNKVYSDSLSMEYYGMLPYTDLEQSRNLINNYIKSESANKSVHRVICRNGTNEYMGEIGIFNINTMHHRANAYCILSPEYRGKGISVDASALFYDEVFRTRQINRIQALVDNRNTNALKSLEGIGFSYEGVLSQYEFFEGKYIDIAVFALLKERFYALYY